MLRSKLAFIMGPPRSGTTALTRMLMSHPDVFLADAKSLRSVNDDAPTYYESAIFFRDISDDEILARFEALDGFGKVILEKTPSHIFHLDRIRKLFPQAYFLMTHREPYSCMCSWKVASREFIKTGFSFGDACINWRTSIEIILNNLNHCNTLVIDYHEFMKDAGGIAEAAFQKLHLNQDHQDICLQLMNAPETERLPEVVGETIRGGNTKLTPLERYRVFRTCHKTERAWKRALKVDLRIQV